MTLEQRKKETLNIYLKHFNELQDDKEKLKFNDLLLQHLGGVNKTLQLKVRQDQKEEQERAEANSGLPRPFIPDDLFPQFKTSLVPAMGHYDPISAAYRSALSVYSQHLVKLEDIREFNQLANSSDEILNFCEDPENLCEVRISGCPHWLIGEILEYRNAIIIRGFAESQ